MIKTIQNTKLLLLSCVAVCASSCIKNALNHYDDICDYTVQLRYDYNEENSTSENRIDYVVRSLEEYVFDEREILVAINDIGRDICDGTWHSDLNLPPGRYSVIAVANRDHRSRLWDNASGGTPVKGVTHRDDMRMALESADTFDDGTKGESEKLYHGYRTFTIASQALTYIRVDMVHSHLLLRVRVTWRNNATPPKGEDYYVALETVPSDYRLMPEYIYPAGSFTYQTHNPVVHDHYPSVNNDVIHHIPKTCHELNNELIHRYDTRVNADNELWGEFTTYRVKLASSPKLRIARSSDNALIVPKVIDLYEYFDWYEIEPDYELKQEYFIDIVIDGDKIILMPLNIADWDEGDTLS